MFQLSIVKVGVRVAGACLGVLLSTSSLRAQELAPPGRGEVDDPGALAVFDAIGSGRTVLAGMIFDAELQVIAGAYVELRPLQPGGLTPRSFDGDPEMFTFSETDGSYGLMGVPTGNWLMTVVGSRSERAVHEYHVFAASLTPDELPDGVTISRFLEVVEPRERGQLTMNKTLGLAFPRSAGAGFEAVVSGAFDTER